MGFPLITAVALAALLPVSGEDTNPLPGTIAPGTITIERSEDGAAARSDPLFADAVQHAILRTGFFVLPAPSHSRYIARVAVTQDSRGLVTSGSKGGPPAAGVANWGAAVSMRLPTKHEQLRGLVVTQLTVTVLLRSDRHVAWSGSAVTAQVDGTPAGAPDAVAGKLAEALFAQFPNRLDAPLSVP